MSVPSTPQLRAGEREHIEPSDTEAGHGDPGPRAAEDLAKCEALISRAAATGTILDNADVDAVRNARCAFGRGVWNRATASAFYGAMSRIAAASHYPGSSIVADLDHCRDMVSYGAQNGKPLDEHDVEAMSRARAAQQNRTWNAETESAFYAAMSRIAHAVTPVVAATAGNEAREGARRAIRIYTRSAIALTVLVVSLSCLLFVGNQISSDIANVVKSNDAAALTLHNQLQAHAVAIGEAVKKKDDAALIALQNSQPALQIKEELQNFATNNRQLFADVSRISALTTGLGLGVIRSPYKRPCDDQESVLNFQSAYRTSHSRRYTGGNVDSDWQCNPDVARKVLEITLPLLAKPRAQTGDEHPPTDLDAVEQGFQKIAVYQDIRAMALYANDIILSIVGAVTGFLLPVLYAWLGACAAILRQLSAESSASTFHPEHSKVANRAHVTSAIIVGISIGLFSKLLEGGKDVSPLALAFIAGYASDKFFYFVDRLVGAMFPPRDAPPARGHASGTLSGGKTRISAGSAAARSVEGGESPRGHA
ncbi:MULTISPECIES: hypothetical protein [unclassified Caballeronia]|uniref:hypothetical protein n=1 Tax=unclassified Caballeronia TaxID=2646786 RepID=UPI00285AF382|nr:MULTISPECIES: hypothetical protein [unclassified Caballeronia]MDR5771560.1 hypothetical protein [Caballeronia sp. LZ002]MDR5846996.1 hypothetical protein [Caballeronia sp. LZ003]